MLKKLVYSILIIVLFSCFNVYAASTCSYSEQAALNSESSKIKASYKVTKELIDPSEYTCYNPSGCEEYREYFTISILNLSENFYIEVSNNLNDAVMKLEPDTENGEITFYWSKINDITKFTFNVYSSFETGCYGEIYRTFHLTTPRKNRFASMNVCESHKDNERCNEYVTFADTNLDEFLKLLNVGSSDEPTSDPTNEDETIFTRIANFIINNKTIIIIACAGLLVVVIVITVISIKKRQRRVL